MSTDPEIEVWQDNNGTWCCRVDGGRTAHSQRRDDAIFWAGWWHGRRELGTSVAVLVERGKSVDIRDREDPRR